MTSLPAHESDVEAEVAKLSEVEVKRYRALFKQSVIQYSSLQFNESLGEGECTLSPNEMSHFVCRCIW